MNGTNTEGGTGCRLQHRLELALAAAKMGTWEWNPLTGEASWDDNVYVLTGVPREAKGAAFALLLEVLHPDDRAEFSERLAMWLTHSQPDSPVNFDFRVLHPHEGLRWLSARCETLVEDGATSMVGVVFDVTELKTAQARLGRAVEEKTEFLAMLGHELRNPISPIVTAVELLERTKEPRAVELAVAIIKRQTQHFRRLIDDLMDVARVSTGKIALHQERVDVTKVMSMAMECCEPLIVRRRHAVELLMPDEPQFVDGDSSRLVQVLTNLIQNAAKYTPDEGRIKIAVEPHSDHIEFKVCDNGPGVPPSLKHTLFDLFTQGSTASAHSEGGLGIGLALVHKLVELHGGGVTVDNLAPCGTEFTVRIPRRARASDRMTVHRENT
jgi:signal transduction histidine kinase